MVWHFTRAEYHLLGTHGIIRPDERVELRDGLIVELPVMKPLHQGASRRLANRLPRLLPPGWLLQIADVVGLATSKPEPDAAVLRGTKRPTTTTSLSRRTPAS
jgi:Uma2 family endonuclease